MATVTMPPIKARREISLPPQVVSVIARYQKSAPVDVNALAKSLGITVYIDENMPTEESGKILRDEEHGGHSGYSIIVNANEPQVRQRFTVAHEIAHYLLHRNLIGDGLTDDALYRSGLSTLEEVHANRLAAEILMPYVLIEAAIKKGHKTVNALAGALFVSPQAISVRLGIPG